MGHADGHQSNVVIHQQQTMCLEFGYMQRQWLRWLGGQWYPQPIRVQILMLALLLDLFHDFWRCAFSGRRRFRRRRGASLGGVRVCVFCPVLFCSIF